MNEELMRAYRGEEKYIFVSYAHKDAADVMPAVKALAAKGYRVWYDEGIEVGDDWAEKIGTSLEKAALVIFFASKNSVRSDNCLRELAFAREHNIPVLTVQLGRFEMPPELSHQLMAIQTANLAGYTTYGSFAGGIAPVLDKYGVGGEAATEIADEKIVFEAKEKGKKKGGIAAAIIVAIAAIGIAAYALLFGSVPNVVGMDYSEGESLVQSKGFKTIVSYNYSDTYEYGKVSQQSKEGTAMKVAVPVVLTQSLGPNEDLTDVPDTVGSHISDGVKMLIDAGLTKFKISPVNKAPELAEKIAAQSIPAGLRVSKANVMTLDVETGGKPLTFEINGKSYTVSGEEEFVLDTEDEEALENLVVSEAVKYLKEKYNNTTLFDDASAPATWGDMRNALIQLYGMSHAYVYGLSDNGWPNEDPAYLIGTDDADGDGLFQGMAAYAAVKAHNKAITANWDSVTDEEFESGIYPGMLVALDYCYARGLIPDDRAFKMISKGEFAVILANVDRYFG